MKKAYVLAALAVGATAVPVLAQGVPTDLPTITNLTVTNVITMLGNLAKDYILPGTLIVTVVGMVIYIFKAARRRVKF